MARDDAFENLQNYLNKIKDPHEDKCWFCNKTPDQIRMEFYEYMKHPSEEFEDIDIEDLLVMSYKTKKPICAACYFAIKQSPDLIKEILERPQDEIW